MSDLGTLLNAEPRSARLSALSRLVQSNHDNIAEIPLTQEVNNHVHTTYSFSPYSPTYAAWMARSSGLQAVGSVDHDSISAAEETVEAAKLLGIGSTVGFEIRVNFDGTSVSGRKINNPDSTNIAYMVVHGVPLPRVNEVMEFLAPINAARNQRNKEQITRLNRILASLEVPQLTWDAVYASSRADEGGSITERHILYTLSLLLMGTVGPGPQMIAFLQDRFGAELPARVAGYLADPVNPHYVYDLLGVLKGAFLPRFFIQPQHDECISVFDAVEFGRSIAAIPAYAYLGDVRESPTGDKKAEQFEDRYLDELFPELTRIGFRAVTYMPPRNTKEQLRRVQELCARHELMEISGVDINSSRQSFTCPDVMEPEFAHLNDATWALIAHEKLTSISPAYSLFGSSSLAEGSLDERIRRYASFGRAMDPWNPASVAAAAGV